MALPKRTLDRRISETTLRRGLARLKPPTDTMLLDKDMLKVSRKLDIVLKRGGNRTREVQRLLDGFASSSTPVMHTRGGSVASSMFFRDRNTIFEILNGLYLPTDTPAFYVPAARRYYDDKIVTGALGSASAYKNNGKLTAIQSLDLNAAKESTWAAVFIYFSTDIANYGQVSRITFQPNIEWSFHDTMDSNPVWTDRVAHLDGWVWFNGYVWLAGYEFNIATNKFEDLSTPSAISYPVAQSTW